MSVSIIEKIIAGSTDTKRARCQNGQFARTLEILDDWTVLRLSFRISMSGTADIAVSPRMFLGVSRGTADTFGSATTANSFGMYSTEVDWTYNAGVTGYYSNVSLFAGSRVGTTVFTSGAALTAGAFFSASNDVRNVIVMEITRGSPFSLRVGFPADATGAETDITDAAFEDSVDTAVSDIATWNANYAPGSAATISIDEGANGVLDSVNFMWDRLTNTFEESDIIFAKVS